MAADGSIASDEQLGRSVASSKSAKRAARSVFRPSDFMPQKGEVEVSIDRLSIAPPGEAVAIAELREGKRNPPRTFYGWAVLTFEAATGKGRHVVPSPTADNPYHGDIVLPEAARDNVKILEEHAQQLADLSVWHPHPDRPT